MSFREQIEGLTESLLISIIDEHHFELVDVEYVKEAGQWYLRVFIDKEGGITVDDCEFVSRKLEQKLDEKDPIVNPYILEVSSPGLDRPLKKEKDYQRNLGKKIEIKLYKPIDKQKQFEGLLKSYDKETLTLEIEAGNEKVLKRSDIAIVRLAIEF